MINMLDVLIGQYSEARCNCCNHQNDAQAQAMAAQQSDAYLQHFHAEMLMRSNYNKALDVMTLQNETEIAKRNQIDDVFSQIVTPI